MLASTETNRNCSFVPWSIWFSTSPLHFLSQVTNIPASISLSWFHFLVIALLFHFSQRVLQPSGFTFSSYETQQPTAFLQASLQVSSCLPFPSLQSSPTSDCLLVGMHAPDPHCAFLPVSTLFFHLPLHHFLSLNRFSLSCHPLFSITTR